MEESRKSAKTEGTVKHSKPKRTHEQKVQDREIIRRKRRENRADYRALHSPFQRFLTKLIIILVLAIMLVGMAFWGWQKGTQTTVTKSYAMVKESLTYWQEFVTLKYRYSDIVSIKKEKYFSASYTLVKYTGIVRAGIPDITKCDIQVSPDRTTLTIKLPDAEILGNEIESQEVFDERHSLFVPLTLDEVFTEIETSKDLALEEILQEGILNEAKAYAAKILQQVFHTAGFEVVEIL
ncbi:MAG: DUF4230 domain-containing protein [Treponema sp.]|nr:DUF4230 domain-containing protein [Treponema sp.]